MLSKTFLFNFTMVCSKCATILILFVQVQCDDRKPCLLHGGRSRPVQEVWLRLLSLPQSPAWGDGRSLLYFHWRPSVLLGNSAASLGEAEWWVGKLISWLGGCTEILSMPPAPAPSPRTLLPKHPVQAIRTQLISNATVMSFGEPTASSQALESYPGLFRACFVTGLD